MPKGNPLLPVKLRNGLAQLVWRSIGVVHICPFEARDVKDCEALRVMVAGGVCGTTPGAIDRLDRHHVGAAYAKQLPPADNVTCVSYARMR